MKVVVNCVSFFVKIPRRHRLAINESLRTQREVTPSRSVHTKTYRNEFLSKIQVTDKFGGHLLMRGERGLAGLWEKVMRRGCDISKKKSNLWSRFCDQRLWKLATLTEGWQFDIWIIVWARGKLAALWKDAKGFWWWLCAFRVAMDCKMCWDARVDLSACPRWLHQTCKKQLGSTEWLSTYQRRRSISTDARNIRAIK